jgi:acetyl-CoA decarbonylase/synthase complex subunit gamma
VVSTRLGWRDRLGAVAVRFDIGRGNYRVAPSPGSPVLVTANYKLTFDVLRRELTGIDAWILALDTRGVNVWCAAGKGTFGTRELERMLLAARMDQVVTHRTLILPQLGASGVAAHEVARDAGWKVRYGPVRAADLPAYLAADMKKDDAMRRVTFKAAERMAIAPAELAHAWPFLSAAIVISFLAALPFGGASAARALQMGLPLVGAVLAATLAFPALLPWLPFRSFALKGAVLGAAWSIAAGLAGSAAPGASAASAAARALIIVPLVSFIAMNFTGASTFTSQPGATLEVRRGLVPMITCVVVGIGCTAAAHVLSL